MVASLLGVTTSHTGVKQICWLGLYYTNEEEGTSPIASICLKQVEGSSELCFSLEGD